MCVFVCFLLLFFFWWAYFRDRSIFIGGWDQCNLDFQYEKNLCPILRENKQKILSHQCWGWKKLKFYDYYSKTSMCPIAFCTGLNTPKNIDQSLSNLQIEFIIKYITGEVIFIYFCTLTLYFHMSDKILKTIQFLGEFFFLFSFFSSICLSFVRQFQCGSGSPKN